MWRVTSCVSLALLLLIKAFYSESGWIWVDLDIECSGSVVVTAYDFESGCPCSNLEWGSIYYEALITAQGSPEPSSLLGSSLYWVPEQLNIKDVFNWGMQVD